MPTFELFVPDLLRALSDPTTPQARLPALRRWLSHAALERSACQSWLQALCERFGVARQDDWPIAPLTLLADGKHPGEAYWLRADPAHLHATRGELVLQKPGGLELTQADAEALVAALNEHFGQEGVQVVAVHPERWYLRAGRRQRLSTTAPAEAVGRSIDPLLPRGEHALSWHRLLNEMQMLLHDHPVNAHREERGLLPVNSVWLWGGGCLPACRPPRALTVWSDAPLARGLALCADVACFGLRAGGESWLQAAGRGDRLVVLDDQACAASASAGLPELERLWFAPLLEAIRAGALKRATLVTQHHSELLRFTTSRLDRWKFWRGVARVGTPALAGAGARA